MLATNSQSFPQVAKPKNSARITHLRWSSESFSFWATVVVAIFGVLTFTTLSVGAFMLLAIAGAALGWFITRLQHAALIGSAVRVTHEMSPIAQLFDDCGHRINAPPVQGFIVQSPLLNAYAFGLTSPQTIVLYSSLIDHLDEDELRFVIGHEMGHTLFNHTRVNSIIGGLAGVPGLPFISMVFAGWSRCAEYSSDRAGLIACGDLEKAQTALVKLTVGPALAKMVTPEQLERQSDDLRRNPMGWLVQLASRHPFVVHRLRELRKFAASQEYQQAVVAINRDAVI